MSLSKRELEKQEEYRAIAREILLEMAIIRTCHCGAITYETYNLEKGQIYSMNKKLQH